MGIKNRFVNAIEATGNPIAPIILQEAYSGANKLGQLMASIADRGEVEGITDKMLEGWSEADLEKLCGSPSFIMALAGLLASSLARYGQSLD